MKAQVIQQPGGRSIVSNPCDEPCPIEQGMRVLGGKWTGSILWHLKDAPVRFNDLARMIGGASKKIIAERLRHLEAHGLIVREVMPTSPVSVHYSITTHGKSALVVLDSLRVWSEDHITQEAEHHGDKTTT